MNKQFITYLSNKLKTGNLRTIHLNAIPGRYATRLDLTKLDLINGIDGQISLFDSKNENLSHDFLFNHLLAKSEFKFKITFDKVPFTDIEDAERKKYDVLATRLNSMLNQNEDNFLEHGVKTFSFGYPLLIKRSKKDPTKIIKAPLLLWSLNISRSNAMKNQWIIEKTDESPIYLNDVLISHINNDEGIIIDDIKSDFLEDGKIDINEIKQITKLILGKFAVELQDPNIRIEPCPDNKRIENITSNLPWILWSGIFGLFRTQKQSIIQDSDKLLTEFENFNFENLIYQPFRTSTNSSVITDPSQEEIISTLEQKEYKVIQGPPGTGKSQSLTAIITNVIENGGKVLVVCEKKTALDVIYNNLANIGLKKLVALIDDVTTDRKKIVSAVRKIIEEVKYEYRGFNEQEYDSNYKRYRYIINDYNNKHKNLLKVVFKGLNVKGVVSEYIKLKKRATTPERILDNVNLSLEETEFDNLFRSIEKGKDLFEEIYKKASYFENLESKIFTEKYTVKTENKLFAEIENELSFIIFIKTKFLLLILAYIPIY